MGNLDVKYGCYADAEIGRQGIRVVVRNDGAERVRNISVAFEWQFETPHAAAAQFGGLDGGPSVPVHEVARKLDFALPRGRSGGELLPGQSRTYLLSPMVVPQLQSIVQALSSEHYRICIAADREEGEIPGNVIGEFIERVFER